MSRAGGTRKKPVIVLVSVLADFLAGVPPAVMLLHTLVPSFFPDPQAGWLTLAMATTLAGTCLQLDPSGWR
jgi:hypothetical protein